MTATAYLLHYLVGLPLAVGFVFGAIISPPDAVAALAVTQHLRVPRRIIVILEGESPINDATSLISFRFAGAAGLNRGERKRQPPETPSQPKTLCRLFLYKKK